jgi:tripartite-type tricarboxylate transporter receptor subunit TctC
LKTIDDAARQAVGDPEFVGAMDKVQTEVAYLGGDEFKQFWQRDAAAVAAVIKRIGKVEKP